MEAQITRLRSTRKICLTFSSRSCGDAELALHQWKRYTCVGVRTLLDLTALRCPACLPGASSLQHLKRSVVGSVHCCPLSNLQLLLLPKIQVCVKGSRTLIESSLVFGFNRISDRRWGGMECGGLLVWFIFRLADGGIWRWRVEAGSEVKCYQFIWSLLALLENLQRSWTHHYSNVTWPCRASSGVWGTESSWLRPWIAACNSLLTCTPPQLPVLPEHLGTWMHTQTTRSHLWHKNQQQHEAQLVRRVIFIIIIIITQQPLQLSPASHWNPEHPLCAAERPHWASFADLN